MASSGSGKGKATANSILFPLAELPGSNDGVDVESWSAEPSLVTHHGVLCRGPQCTEKNAFIRGIRYKCSKCPNVDFDDVCMRDPANDHPRDHVFWPCAGQCIFEDWVNMSPDEIKEVREVAGGVPEEYLVVPQQGGNDGSSVTRCPDPLDLEALGAQLLGINNRISDDQLLVHWKNGVPAVRLVDLLPGDPEDDIQCLFTSTRLDQGHTEPYEAVCCAWIPGDANSNAPTADESAPVIFVGEQCKEVTRATAEVLKALRSPTDIKKVWVEELCIVSEDSGFKAFQERSTSLIYSRAERTTIWAGPEKEDTEVVWTLIEMLSHRCGQETHSLPSPSDLKHDADLEELDLLPIGSEKWRSLLSFFPPHLFTQGWLLHDVAFATEKFVKIGDYELEWEKVARVRELLSQPAWRSLTWSQHRHHDSGYFEGDGRP